MASTIYKNIEKALKKTVEAYITKENIKNLVLIQKYNILYK
jgi:hypothetical protein